MRNSDSNLHKHLTFSSVRSALKILRCAFASHLLLPVSRSYANTSTSMFFLPLLISICRPPPVVSTCSPALVDYMTEHSPSLWLFCTLSRLRGETIKAIYKQL